MKKIIKKLRDFILYHYYKSQYRKKKLNIEILSLETTIDSVINNKASLIRFGDGEFSLIRKKDIVFQDYNYELSHRLLELMAKESNENLIICLPDIFESLDRYIYNTRSLWTILREKNYEMFQKYCVEKTYGNSFISRPYMIYKNKSQSIIIFNKLKKIWKDKDVLIVEGEYSRTGVGNDLFNNSKSVSRIICPSNNAYDKYNEILSSIKKYSNNKIILLMLGPTAKVLGYDLTVAGLQAIDLGHIDSEYEWMKLSATNKVRIPSKHTAEFEDEFNSFYKNEEYQSEIILDLTN